MIMLWLQFLIASAIIIITGKRLSYVGDGIAEKKKWDRTWVGLIIIAFSTSLPELFTSCAAAGIEKQPDLVYGTTLGSVCFNITIFAFLDLIEGKGPFSLKLNPKLIFNGVISIILIFLAIAGITIFSKISLGWIGISSLLIIGVYILGSKLSFNMSARDKTVKDIGNIKFNKVSSSFLWSNYVLCALIILGSGLWLAHTGNTIADKTGLGRSFVGFLFLAIVSSLPELSTTIVAVRGKLYNMAIGIILGANCFNLIILSIADLVYVQGPISRFSSKENLVIAVLGICLTSILMLGIKLRSKKAFLRLGWDAISMIILYLSGMVWLYFWR
jgi:cation:H+ antiporter